MAYYNKNYDLFLESTQSFCHECDNRAKLVETHIVSKWSDVFLRKFCTKCWETWAKISTDKDYYDLCNKYLKQPDLPEKALTKVKNGCPFDCWVCEQHQNHPCLALFNIIDECNMKCNICYHNSEPWAGNPRSMEDIKKMHSTLLEVESEPDLIQVTGGEPSLHPEIIDILKYLKSWPVRHLMLNTNWIRISEDEEFVKELKNLWWWFEVYLQFDSLNADSLKKIRWWDMRKVREKALEMLSKYNISTSLVCVVEKWVNDKELPELIEFATTQKCVRWIVFQPIQNAWRNENSSDDYRITLSEIRKSIIEDKSNPFTADDMIPLPCDPHKICVWYAVKSSYPNPLPDRERKTTIFPVTGKIPRELLIWEKWTIAFEQDKEFIRTVIDTVSLDTAMGENILSNKIKQKLFFQPPKN